MEADRIYTFKRKRLSYLSEHLVSRSILNSKELPLIVSPEITNLSLPQWVAHNKHYIDESLLRFGAILFRGFSLHDVQGFREFVSSACSTVLDYRERSSPRSEIIDKVYTSTDHPADQVIPLHNENSYQNSWPSRIFFYCVRPATEGGQTSIADTRRVLQRINPTIVAVFNNKKILYVRTFREGLGLAWSTAFRTNDKVEVERYCNLAGISCTWGKDETLTTRQLREPLVPHPKTGELLWFNHAAFFHVSSLAPELQRQVCALYEEHELPTNSFYGDGSTIPSDIIGAIQQAYQQETVLIDWMKDDVLMVDNMLVAHGRQPFAGPRMICVAMGDPVMR